MKDLCQLLQRKLLSLLSFYVVLRMKIPLLTIFGVSSSGYSRKQEDHNLSRSALSNQGPVSR